MDSSGEGDTENVEGAAACGDGATASPAPVPCSICLDAVKDGGERSTAKLLCGHQFHLDCIGSAFNAKGVMQCPNCRKIEKGDWLYANGCLSFREVSVDDWAYDEDLYDLNFSEMSYGVRWCPFTRVAHVPSSFEEGEPPSISYHSLEGHRAVFSIHPAASLAHSCPYMAYLHPLQPSSSSSSQVSTENVIDDPTFRHGSSSQQHGPASMQTSHPFSAVDGHYHRRESHSPPYSYLNSRINSAEQASVPSASLRTTRHDWDGHLRPGTSVHPFVMRHALGSRANTSAESVVPSYLGSSHTHARVQDLHGTYQQQSAVGTSTPSIPGTRRSSGIRNLASRAPTLSDHSAFYLFPSASSGQSPQDAEATGVNRFYAWERDQFTPFPLMPVERGSAWWGPLQQIPRPSDTGTQTGSWHQHGSERSSSQGLSEGFSHPPHHPPQMYPFI